MNLLRRPVAVCMATLALCLTGLIATFRLPVTLLPPGFTNPELDIGIPFPGGTPSEVEEGILRPVEAALRQVGGLKELRSTARADVATLGLTFHAHVDMNVAYQDVREQLERLRPSLPPGTERYHLRRFNPDTDLPMFMMAVLAPPGTADIDTLLENLIRPALERVDGVAQVQFHGLVERRMDIDLDGARVRSARVDLGSLVRRLSADNRSLPLGSVDVEGHTHLVRALAEFADPAEIEAFPVRPGLELGRIATVAPALALRDFVVRVNRRLSRTAMVSKESDANTVEVAGRLRSVLERELPRDPRLRDFQYIVFFDQGQIISEALQGLAQTAYWGALVAVVILLAFLRSVSLTTLVALAMPISGLLALAGLFFLGGGLNILSLAGLTLGIGMLVDNAIVVVENIFRLRRGGADAAEAAARGAREVGLAVTLSTLTTILVFVPLGFLAADSNVRLLAGQMGLTITLSLVGSLVVALVLVPLVTSWVPSRAAPPAAGQATGIAARAYRAMLRWALAARPEAVLIAILILATTALPYRRMKIAQRFEPGISRASIKLELPEHFTLADANGVLEQLETFFQAQKEELGFADFVSFFNRGSGTIRLFMRPDRRLTAEALSDFVRRRMPRLPGVSQRLELDEAAGGRDHVEVQLEGPDTAVLQRLAGEAQALLEALPELVAVTSDLERSQGELHVRLDRELAGAAGLDARLAAEVLAWNLRGTRVGSFRAEGRELPLWLGLADRDKESLAELDRVLLPGAGGQGLPLRALARTQIVRAPPHIRRVDGRSLLTLRANAPGQDLRRTSERVREHLQRNLVLPEGYRLRQSGSLNEFEEMGRDLSLAGLLSTFLIIAVMGVLFESLILPLAIICSLPYALAGSLWLLDLWGIPLDAMARLGLVLLLGIVVNNAIVLIDCINRLRAEGRARAQAIVEGASLRLRPVAMTTLTTLGALVPMALAPDTGTGLSYRSLAVSVMGGLALATVCTLLVVPLAYDLLESLRGLWRSR